jgi:hypothetical protein
MFLIMFNDRLIRTCLDLIKAERDHEVINNQLIRATIQSYGKNKKEIYAFLV